MCFCHTTQLDLASLKSVRQFVEEFHSSGKPLHVLCNNAGMTTGFRNSVGPVKTEDGFEVTFGINHLGKFPLPYKKCMLSLAVLISRLSCKIIRQVRS